MKFAILTAAAVLSTASAFTPAATTQPHVTTTSLDMSSHHLIDNPDELSDHRNEEILSALGNMEGPSISYGHFAVLENRKPTDIKEYDNFDAFKAAIDQAECTKILRGNGPFTVFAPTNTAIENFNGILSEEVIKCHIVPQDLYTDELDGELETLSGHKLKAERKYRKIYVDNVLVGQLDNHSGGTHYPTNAICDNGVIHAINSVLTPGYEATVSDSQGVQGLSLQSHLKQDVLKDRGALPDEASDKH